MCEAVFAAFDAARKSHRLTLKQLEAEWVLSYCLQVYAI